MCRENLNQVFVQEEMLKTHVQMKSQRQIGIKWLQSLSQL